MSPDKFVPYRLLSGDAHSPRLHRRLDVYMSTWLLLHSLVSLLDMNVSVYFSTVFEGPRLLEPRIDRVGGLNYPEGPAMDQMYLHEERDERHIKESG